MGLSAKNKFLTFCSYNSKKKIKEKVAIHNSITNLHVQTWYRSATIQSALGQGSHFSFLGLSTKILDKSILMPLGIIPILLVKIKRPRDYTCSIHRSLQRVLIIIYLKEIMIRLYTAYLFILYKCKKTLNICIIGIKGKQSRLT